MAIDPKYTPIFTNVGLTKIANAMANGTKIVLDKFAIGDANATDYTPNATQFALVHELTRIDLRTVWYADFSDGSRTLLEISALIKAGTISGTIREVGVYDKAGDLILIARTPDRQTITADNMSISINYTTQISIANNERVFAVTQAPSGDYVTLFEYNGHVNDFSNPHGTTKAQIQLGSVDNTADNVKNVLSATKFTTARNINGISFNGTADIELEDRVGANIAAAATTVIGTVGIGNYVKITGAVNIASFGTAGRAGIKRTLIFDSALTVINGSNLVCPGNANIGILANTIVEVVAETTTTWRVISITHPSVSMEKIGYLANASSDIQGQLNNKAPLASPALTGAPTAPTAAAGTNTTQLATTAFVTTALTTKANTDQQMYIGTTAVPINRASNAITLAGTSISGNAGTATTLAGGTSDWTSYRSQAVANMLGWKNYGNNHVIFDASNATAPNGAAISNTNPSNVWSGSCPTLMGWNGSSTYGVRVDSARTSDLLNGYQIHDQQLNNQANKVVRTDPNGYVQFGYIHCTSGNENNNANPDRVWGTNGSDGYLRTYRTSALRVSYADSAYSALYQSASGGATCDAKFKQTPAHGTSFSECSGVADAPNNGWWMIYSIRHSNSSNYWGTQIAYGWEDNANAIYQRNVVAGSWSAWTRVDVSSANITELANNAGFITSAGRAYSRRSDGGDLNFYWSGQGGQPSWLWGGGDGTNMYVYNPSNFSVNYANSAGTVNSLGNYACKAWGNINGTGAASIRASGNLSSVSDFGAGYYGINFASAMPDANYAALVTVGPLASGADHSLLGDMSTTNVTYTNTGFRVNVMSAGVGPNDKLYVNIAVFR